MGKRSNQQPVVRLILHKWLLFLIPVLLGIPGISRGAYVSIPQIKSELELEGEARSFWFTVVAEEQEYAEKVLIEMEKVLGRIRRDLNLKRRLSKKCLVLVWSSEKDFSEGIIALGLWGGMGAKAFYVPSGGRLPHILCFYRDEDLFPELLPHELTHLVLHITLDPSGKCPLPLWLDEGLAECQTAKDFGETAANIREARKSGEYIPLEELVSFNRYPRERERIRLFYAESTALVKFLLSNETYPGEFFQLAKRLSFWGGGFMKSFRKTYGRKYSDYSALEDDFIKFIEANAVLDLFPVQ